MSHKKLISTSDADSSEDEDKDKKKKKGLGLNQTIKLQSAEKSRKFSKKLILTFER